MASKDDAWRWMWRCRRCDESSYRYWPDQPSALAGAIEHLSDIHPARAPIGFACPA